MNDHPLTPLQQQTLAALPVLLVASFILLAIVAVWWIALAATRNRRIDRWTAAIAAVTWASDDELATWEPERVRSADKALAAGEQWSAHWNQFSHELTGDELWRDVHRLLTDTRAARARIRAHLTAGTQP